MPPLVGIGKCIQIPQPDPCLPVGRFSLTCRTGKLTNIAPFRCCVRFLTPYLLCWNRSIRLLFEIVVPPQAWTSIVWRFIHPSLEPVGKMLDSIITLDDFIRGDFAR